MNAPPQFGGTGDPTVDKLNRTTGPPLVWRRVAPGRVRPYSETGDPAGVELDDAAALAIRLGSRP